ncbi:MAG: carbohydrate-binding family 9-like protein [Lentisphaeria bacterium]
MLFRSTAMLLVILLLSSRAGAVSENNGFLAIGNSSIAPVIDGRLDDLAWKECIEVSPFLLAKQNRFAIEQTSVRMCWDTDSLYVAFECMEWALEPLANRMHEFQANIVTPDDKNIFSDDCIVLLLQPAPEGPVYDFAVNANGILTDSIAQANNLWSSRDSSYSSEATVAAARYPEDQRGRWCLEMAIPLKNLAASPKAGDQWRFMVGRFEKSRKEISAFQRTQRGVHHASSLGGLRFLATTPGISLSSLPAFLPGKNQFSVQLHNEQYQMPIRFTAAVQFVKQKPAYFSAHVPNDRKQGDCPFELLGSGEFSFFWQAENAASLEPLLRSPKYALRVNSNQISDLQTSGQVYVNGRKVEKGSMLSSGINTIAIASQEPFNASFQVGDFTYRIHSNWKYHPQEMPGWEKPDFSDAEWEYASDAGEQAPGYYRFRLLLEHSVIWPNWGIEGVAINRGGFQQIIFSPSGLQGQSIQDYVIHFDLPEAFSSPGASGYYKVWPFEFQEQGKRVYQGKNYRRYSLALQKSVPWNPDLPLWQQIAFLIQAPEQHADEEAFFYYSISSRSLALEEVPQPVKIRLLEPLRGKQPKKLDLQLWTGWLSRMDRPELLMLYGDQFVKMGVTSTGGLNNTHPQLNHFYLFNFAHWNFSCAPYLEKHPDQVLIDRHGKKFSDPKNALVCSSTLLKDPQFAEYLRQNLPEWYERMKRPDNIHLDYEERVMSSYLACFCPRCLQDFAQLNQIQEELTPELIEQKYFKEWTVYMNRKVADFCQVLKKQIKELFPGSVLTAYSAYQSPESLHYYGIDWKMMAPHLDYVACGYGRNERELKDTREAVGKTPLMLGAIVYPYDVKARTAPNYTSLAKLLRRACDATAGILIYSLESLDGRTFDAMATVSRIMAEYETFFLKGEQVAEKIQLHGFDRADYEVLRDSEGKLLMALMNPTSGARPFHFKAELPPACKLVNILTGEILQTNEASGTIPSDGIAVFVTQEAK